MVRHLDEAAMKALEAADAELTAHFREHLRRPCAECEAFLATSPGRLWWLDAEADRLLLLHGAAEPAAAADHSGFSAVRRAMRRQTARRALGSALAVAAAASLAFAVLSR